MKYFLVLMIVSCWGSENSKANDDLYQKTAQQFQQVKEDLLKTESTQREILSSLYLINQKMKGLSRHRDRMTNRLFASQADASLIAQQVVRLERQLGSQKQILRKRLRGLYLFSGPSVLRTLFSSQSPTQLDKNFKFLKILTERDYLLFKDYEKTFHTYLSKKNKLTQQVRRLTQLQKGLKSKETEIINEQKKKQILFSKNADAKEKHLQQLLEIRKKQKNQIVPDHKNGEFSTAFFEQRGSLEPPVEGNVAKHFGFIQDPKDHFRLAHKGLFYQTVKNAPVQNPFQGRVAFVGKIPGYGDTLILDHGDHYYTIYGHLTSAFVKANESIAAGKIVGTAGGKSPLFGTGLYFEIRHFSDAVDPEPWLRNNQWNKTNKI
ncbi:MAG: peptidoglycan DD-metalloendopeptidase family protein [Bdellovibrionales bacterium]|nr:peptidoglycan DD-metalloendopeptidase family protein [Bdellovibrionales bacterium]